MRRSSSRVVVSACVAILVTGSACLNRRAESPQPAPSLAAPIPVVQTSAPPQPVAGRDSVPVLDEDRVTLKTSAPTDAKLLLKYIADSAGYSLILPPGPGPRVEVDLVDVPASLALRHVLDRAGYTLAPMKGLSIGFDTTVVYYRLPTNVDSLSVDAIVKRYGVSRAVAELLVNSRKR